MPCAANVTTFAGVLIFLCSPLVISPNAALAQSSKLGNTTNDIEAFKKAFDIALDRYSLCLNERLKKFGSSCERAELLGQAIVDGCNAELEQMKFTYATRSTYQDSLRFADSTKAIKERWATTQIIELRIDGRCSK